jgi:hypothetical protein
VAVLGRADAQPFLDRRIEVADRDAAHRYGFACLHGAIIINDCDDVKLLRFRSGSAPRDKPDFDAL